MFRNHTEMLEKVLRDESDPRADAARASGAGFLVGWVFIATGVAAALVMIGLTLWTLQRKTPALPVYSQLTDFSLTDSRNRTIRLSSLRGKIWVAALTFTRCEAACPAQVAEMALLQKEFKNAPDFRLVAVTVDPEYDTAAVLRKYAARLGADPDRWHFLTGEKTAIDSLARGGFRLAYGTRKSRRPPPARKPGRLAATAARLLAPAPAYAHHPGGRHSEAITHSSRFVLVDRRGRIRGYYHSTAVLELVKLRGDIRVLLGEKE